MYDIAGIGSGDSHLFWCFAFTARENFRSTRAHRARWLKRVLQNELRIKESIKVRSGKLRILHLMYAAYLIKQTRRNKVHSATG